MRKGLFILLALLATVEIQAQSVAEIARTKPQIKLSILPMFHLDNAFMLGAEIPMGNGRFSLQPEFGYGPAQSNLWYEWWFHDSYPDKTTIRTKLQFRSYFKEGSVFRGYYGAEYSYLQSDFNQDHSYMANGLPVVINPLELRRTSHAVHGIMGWQGYFSNRLTIDFQFGFGLKATENRSLTPGIPQDELDKIKLDERKWLGRSLSLGQYGPFPSFMTAISIGFVLGKVN